MFQMFKIQIAMIYKNSCNWEMDTTALRSLVKKDILDRLILIIILLEKNSAMVNLGKYSWLSNYKYMEMKILKNVKLSSLL